MNFDGNGQNPTLCIIDGAFREIGTVLEVLFASILAYLSYSSVFMKER